MNVYIHIDQSWSYRFLTKHKRTIAEYDFFTFSDRFLMVAANTLKAYINYQQTGNAVNYHIEMNQVGQLCEDYPLLGPYLHQAFVNLRNTHIDALTAIHGCVTTYQPIIDDTYLLIGILFTVDIRTNLNPILQL